MGKVGESFLEKVTLELDLEPRWMLAGSSLFRWEEDRLWMLTFCCVISAGDSAQTLTAFLLCNLGIARAQVTGLLRELMRYDIDEEIAK